MKLGKGLEAIEEALEGADWEVVNGKKHRKIYIGDRLVGVVSHGTSTSNVRMIQNLAHKIRRARGI